MNSAAVRDPALLQRCADRFGAQCMVIAIDAKRRASERRAGRSSSTPAARRPAATPSSGPVEATTEHGAGEVLLTSMDRDGTGEGYDLELLRADRATRCAVPVVASGGAGDLEHFAEALTEGRADAVLAASRLHFGELTIREVKEHLRAGREVRL